MDIKTGCPRQFYCSFVILFSIAIVGFSACGSTEAEERQAPETSAKLPEFEVALVKPTPRDQQILNTYLTYPGGRIACKGCTLKYLVMEAFHVQDYQIAGLPHWIEEEQFDVEAKSPESSESSKSNPSSSKLPPNDEQREMTQALLIERFHLKYRRDTREGNVYAMTAREKSLKLQAPKNKNEFPWAGSLSGGVPNGDGLGGMNISMPQLAERVSRWLERPVLDQTDVKGSFDFEYRSGEDEANSHFDLVSSVITSLKELGLDLKSAKGPIETLVIENVERPSAN